MQHLEAKHRAEHALAYNVCLYRATRHDQPSHTCMVDVTPVSPSTMSCLKPISTCIS